MAVLEQNKKKWISGRIKFLLGIFALYLFLAFCDRDLFYESLLGTTKMLKTILPLLVFIVFFMTFVNQSFSSKRIKKHLGTDSGWKAWFWAIFAGILVGGPPYLLFPMVKDLKRKGVSDALIAVFLYNRNIKIPFLPAMIMYFGIPFTVVLSFYILIFSIISGILLEKLMKKKIFLKL